mmetsp:Transcript_44542/g.53464  ORF Transcript_44542/g.53464 Transcript_44542/m.53464 type:complete len:85 (+) Transcript_44542:1092-1346(+)
MSPYVPRRLQLDTIVKQPTLPTQPPPPPRERSTKSTQKLMMDAARALNESSVVLAQAALLGNNISSKNSSVKNMAELKNTDVVR